MPDLVQDATQDVTSVGQRRRMRRPPMAMGDTANPASTPQTSTSSTARPPAPQTFQQMQAAGIARPAPPSQQPAATPTQFRSTLQNSVQAALDNGGSRYSLPEVARVRSALQRDLAQQFTARRTALDEEMARRGIGASSIAGGYLGDLEGQHATALANLDADLIRDAAATNAADRSSAWGAASGVAGQNTQAEQFGLQHQLAQALGLGNLSLQERSLEQSGEQFDRTFGLQQQIQTGQLTLQQAAQQLQERVATGQLTIAQAQQALAELQNTQSVGQFNQTLEEQRLARTQQGTQFTQQMAEQTAARLQQQGQFTAQLAEAVATRLQNKSLAEAELELNRMVQTGQLTIDQKRLALQERQTDLQSEQFTQQLEQALEIARMGDVTANRNIDANAALAQNDLWLRIAQLLGGLGFPVNRNGPTTTWTPTTRTNGPNGTNDDDDDGGPGPTNPDGTPRLR